MSVLNKMLKDIEKRDKQVNDFGLEQTVQVNPVRDYRQWFIRGLVLVTALCLVAAGYLFIPVASDTKPRLKAQKPPHEVRPTQGSDAPTEVIKTSARIDAATQLPEPKKPNVEPEPEAIVTEAPKAVKATPENNSPGKVETKARKPQPAEVKSTAKKTSPKAQQTEAKVVFKRELPASPTEQAQTAFSKGKQALMYGLAQEAIEHFNQALALNPGHLEARSMLVSAYFSQDKIRIAEGILIQGLALRPEVMRWRITLAKLLAAQQRYGAVLEVLVDEYQDMAPLDYWILRGTAAQQQGRHDIAVVCFEYLTKRRSSKAKWWLARATSEQALGKHALAATHFRTALALGGLSFSSQQFAEQRLRQIGGQ